MSHKKKLEELKQHIEKKYDAEQGAKTSLWSEGNYDDVFSDGAEYGKCWALYEVARVIGLDLQPPDEPDCDY